MKIKKSIPFIASFILIASSVFLCYLGGSSLHRIDRTNRINDFIGSITKERVYGEGLFADIKLNNDSLEEMNKCKSSFDEALNNKIGYASFYSKLQINENVEISDVTLLECNYVDNNFNDWHMYTDRNWHSIDDNCIFIPQSLEIKLLGNYKLDSIVGAEINVCSNGVTQTMKVSGTYNDVSKTIPGYFSRGYQANQIYKDIIFMSNKSICMFNPNRAIAMFSHDSANNGIKYNTLEEFSNRQGSSITLDFKNDEDTMGLWLQVSSNEVNPMSIVLSILIIFTMITILILFGALIDECLIINRNKSKKILYLYESVFYVFIIVVPLLSVIAFKNVTWNIFGFSTALVNKISLILISFTLFAYLGYFLYKNRVLFNKLIRKENNFETDNINESNGMCLFLGNFYTDSLLDSEFSNNKAISLSNSNYEKNFLTILQHSFKCVTSITYPAMFEKRKHIIKEESYVVDNLKVISLKNRMNKLNWFFVRKGIIKSYLLELSKKQNFESIYISTYHYSFIIKFIRNLFPDAKISMLLPDLPSIKISSSSKLHRLRMKFIEKNLKCNLKYIDFLLPITKQQAEYLGYPLDKCRIFECYFDAKKFDQIPKNSSEKYILYCGSLTDEYGVLDLINSFISTKSVDKFKLYICGSGNLAEKISDISDKNNKIVFLGMVSSEKALCLEKNASLIVVPDHVTREYSFHSKYIEILASGTPLLCYKPSGAKAEYIEFMNIIDNSISESIDNCLLYNYQDALEKAERAKKFIKNNKNLEYFKNEIIN